MRTIDGDLKKTSDELNETKNHYNSVAKKEGTTYMTKDLGDIIYNNSHVDPDLFVEYKKSE